MQTHPPPVIQRPDGRLSDRRRQMKAQRPLRHRQRGAIALFMTVIILLAVTLTVIFTARTASMEQRMSANEVRAKQAANAAQAGLERAVAYVQGMGNNNVQQTFTADFAANGMTYRARLWNVDAATPPPACAVNPSLPAFTTGNTGNTPINTRNVLIYACGWSDDLSARKVAMVQIKAGPSLGYPPTNPVISRGAALVNGHARVFNLFNNLTVWAGANLSVSGNPGNTFVRHPNEEVPSLDLLKSLSDSDGNALLLPGKPATCGNKVGKYVCTTDKAKVGPDVIDHDLSIADLNDAEFFQNFMGMNKADYKNNIATAVYTTSSPDLSQVAGQVVWIEHNDVNLSGTVGSRANPVVLVVNGDLRISGQFTFYGVIYVDGDLWATGGPEFYGSVIIRGDLDKGAGTPYFIFDPVAASGANELGRRSVISGTWRDWL